MRLKWIPSLTLVFMLAAGLAACSSAPKPFEYHDVREEKPGPGLFTGEEGGVVIRSNPGAAEATGGYRQ
jgi:hypothetical protein